MNPPIVVLLIKVRFEMFTELVGLPCFINEMVLDPLAKLVAVPVIVTGNFCPRLALVGLIVIVWAKPPNINNKNKEVRVNFIFIFFCLVLTNVTKGFNRVEFF